MRRAWGVVVAAVALLTVGVAAAQEDSQAPVMTPPANMTEPPMLPDEAVDYASKASWLCRPDKADSFCKTDLDAMQVDGSGARTPAKFEAAKDPKVDCFYVYPTISEDKSLFSDMVPNDRERASVVSQAARFASVCKVYAPVYRQWTMTALRWVFTGHALPNSDRNYEDVKKAWAYYMAHDNKGRGVVLIGHSQGAILLQRLIKEEIDGKPAQKRLVSALLAGNLDLTVAPGSDRGGSFASVPLCRTVGQTGCVVAWSSVQADITGPRLFGANKGDKVGACVNPAALGGGTGVLKTYIRKPSFAPAGDPPYVLATNQFSAECVADAQGNVLKVSTLPGPWKSFADTYIARSIGGPGWGLHVHDMELVEGNLLDVVAAQVAAWRG